MPRSRSRPAPPAGARSTARSKSSPRTPRRSSPRPPGAGNSRCCSVSSGSSRATSRSSPTARSSQRIRWTPSRARSRRCSPRHSARPDGNGRGSASPDLLASADILGPEDVAAEPAQAPPADEVEAAGDEDEEESEEEPDEDEDDYDEDDDDLEPVERAAPEEDEEDDLDDEPEEPEIDGLEEDIEPEADSDEEPRDWVEEAEDDGYGEAPEDPNAAKRFWFEHATGAGKTVAALGFVEASQTGGVLILTHRRNLVDQFNGELRDRGYAKRISRPLLKGEDSTKGPVTVETYQWFVRNAGKISSAYTIVICDEAHTALGEKTSAAIRNWTGPIFIGMTATGALIARHVTDLFPTQTSRFDLAQAARRGVIAPLRCVRISPGVGVRTIAKVPLRRGEVDTEFDQDELAKLLDQQPFNLAVANLYKTRFNGVPGVVYAAGVRHAYNLAEAFRAEGIKAQAVSGETPKRELVEILAAYERGDIDVLINAQLLAEGWNSPRATVCVHLAPTASKRIYQQRVGRVTRRHPGKEAGLVVDFVHPATKHDDPVVTLHSLLDRDVYRGGRDRRRSGAPRPRTADARRAARAAGVRRGGAAVRRLRARAVADRGRASRLRRAARVGGARRGAGGAERLAARAGDAPLRPHGRAQEPLPDHGGPAQQEPAAAAARARRRRRAARPRRLRYRDRHHRRLAARGAQGGDEDHAARARRAAHRPPRPGERMDLAPRRVHARRARGVRRAALARDQAPARACSSTPPAARTRATRAG